MLLILIVTVEEFIRVAYGNPNQLFSSQLAGGPDALRGNAAARVHNGVVHRRMLECADHGRADRDNPAPALAHARDRARR